MLHTPTAIFPNSQGSLVPQHSVDRSPVDEMSYDIFDSSDRTFPEPTSPPSPPLLKSSWSLVYTCRCRLSTSVLPVRRVYPNSSNSVVTLSRPRETDVTSVKSLPLDLRLSDRSFVSILRPFPIHTGRHPSLWLLLPHKNYSYIHQMSRESTVVPLLTVPPLFVESVRS